jgi:hypothetical protein
LKNAFADGLCAVQGFAADFNLLRLKELVDRVLPVLKENA